MYKPYYVIYRVAVDLVNGIDQWNSPPSEKFFHIKK